jgi:hypothetical protein
MTRIAHTKPTEIRMIRCLSSAAAAARSFCSVVPLVSAGTGALVVGSRSVGTGVLELVEVDGGDEGDTVGGGKVAVETIGRSAVSRAV